MILVPEQDFVLIGFEESIVCRDMLRMIKTSIKDAYIVQADEFLAHNYNYSNKLFIVGFMNDQNTRLAVIEKIKQFSICCFSFIHSTASVNDKHLIGTSVFVSANATIQFNSTIGNYTIISPNTHISHSVSVGENCYISSCVTIYGKVNIGNNCIISAGSSIIDRVNVADDVILLYKTNVI